MPKLTFADWVEVIAIALAALFGIALVFLLP